MKLAEQVNKKISGISVTDRVIDAVKELGITADDNMDQAVKKIAKFADLDTPEGFALIRTVLKTFVFEQSVASLGKIPSPAIGVVLPKTKTRSKEKTSKILKVKGVNKKKKDDNKKD